MGIDIEKLRVEVMGKTKEKLRKELAKEEIHIVKAVNTLEDMDKAFNMLYEDICDWYALHFPELMRFELEPEQLLKLIAELKTRANFTEQKVGKILDGVKAKEIVKKALESTGAELTESVAIALSLLAKKALEILKAREELANFIEREMEKSFPNLSIVATPLLAARLLRATKSLKKLAFMPASTIQVLGAEKALFKHLRRGTKPPKHGFILQHPLMRKVPKKARGKLARAIATKISIAAREDYFGKNTELGRKLREELEKRAEELVSG